MRRKRDLQLTLAEIAERLGAEAPAPSDAAVAISGLGDLDEAGPRDLAFVTGPKYMEKALASKAGAFLVPMGQRIKGRPCLAVADVWKSVFVALDLFWPEETPAAGIDPTAVVAREARIGANVSVGPLTVIERGAEVGENVEISAQCFIGRDARIGEGCLLHPGVRVLERVEVGRRVILHSGVVLGADGYGYKFVEGALKKVPQVGTVVIEDDVEIGANTCIDRATFGETRVGAGTKIDNLCQIAHNCRIGRMCGLAAQVGLSGSVRVGDLCMFWGQVGVADQLKIGGGAQILAQSGVKNDVPDGGRYFGSPAAPVGEAGRLLAAQKYLPDILKRLRALEKKAK